MVNKQNKAYLFLLAVMVFSVLATPFAFLGFAPGPAGDSPLQENALPSGEEVVTNSDLKQFKSAPSGVPGMVSSIDAVLFVSGGVSSYDKSAFDSSISGLEGVRKVSSALSSEQGFVFYTALVELRDLNYYGSVTGSIAGSGVFESPSFYKRGLVEYVEADFVDVYDENKGQRITAGLLPTALFALAVEGGEVVSACTLAVDSSGRVVEGSCQQAVP